MPMSDQAPASEEAADTKATEDFAGDPGFFRRIVEKTGDLVVVHQSGTLLYVNPTLATCLGYESPSDLIGKPLALILHPEDIPRENRRIRVMLATNENSPLYTYRLQKRDAHC